MTIESRIRKAGFPQNFNIGAGLDDNGELGYNFLGKISQVLVYNRQLSAYEIQTFADGGAPEGEKLVNWTGVN